MNLITAEYLRQIVCDRIEPTEPVDTIYKVLKEHDGKRLDKRIIDKIIAATGNDSIRLVRRYGMTQIAWQTGPENIQSMVIAYAEKNVVNNAQSIHDNNTCYFAARDERNAVRQASLNSHSIFAQLAVAANEFARAKERLNNLLNAKEIDPDRYCLEKVCGLALLPQTG